MEVTAEALAREEVCWLYWVMILDSAAEVAAMIGSTAEAKRHPLCRPGRYTAPVWWAALPCWRPQCSHSLIYESPPSRPFFHPPPDHRLIAPPLLCWDCEHAQLWSLLYDKDQEFRMQVHHMDWIWWPCNFCVLQRTLLVSLRLLCCYLFREGIAIYIRKALSVHRRCYCVSYFSTMSE